jgi:dienelactone hydrolase
MPTNTATLLETEALILIEGEVTGHPDFEIDNAPRLNTVPYWCYLPANCTPNNPAKGLVFVIAGFGNDSQLSYRQNLCQHMAKTHGYAAVTVDFHCIHSRPGEHCNFVFDADEIGLVELLMKQLRLPWNPDDWHRGLDALGRHLPCAMVLNASLTPTNGDTQNFGVLQALDHLQVLHALTQNPAVYFDADNVVALGSSHGGYIAHLMAKIAPNTLNAIIDNSSYTAAPLSYLGVKSEYNVVLGNLSVRSSVVSRWQFSVCDEPTYFGLPQQLMRDLIYPPHLAVMQAVSQRLPQVVAFNSVVDIISPVAEKQLQHQLLQALGCNAQLQVVTAEDIDGKLFKVLAHGLDASLKGVFAKALPAIAPRAGQSDAQLGSVVAYACGNATYTFTHSPEAGVTATFAKYSLK